MATIETGADVWITPRDGWEVHGIVLNCDAVALTIESQDDDRDIVIPWSNVATARVEVTQ